jgi:hypothetical protein
MRFMVIGKATKSSEAGDLPSEELMTEMGKFNEELIKAGVMLASEGLQPSSKGARVKFAGEKRIVVDGPFTETKELVAGFQLWKCASLQEAIEWVKRCPNPTGEEAVIEIRQLFEEEDFKTWEEQAFVSASQPNLGHEVTEKLATEMGAPVERR